MRFSVIITTHNRVDTLPRTVESVLAQDESLELIIVDDGSTDDTPAFLETLGDSRVHVVRRANGGLSAARNTGLAHAAGEWTVFLDDDDVALPGWLKTFGELADPGIGVVCCAANYCSPDGTPLGSVHPEPMGSMFANHTGLFFAGTFASRTDLLQATGGYDEHLTCSHQTDLGMRITALLTEHGLSVASTNTALLQIERRAPHDRPLSSPAVLYHGTKHLLAKHREKFAGDAVERARTLGVLGVSAARLGRWSEAKTALLDSARAEPTNVRRWARVATVWFPPLARQVWRTSLYQGSAA